LSIKITFRQLGQHGWLGNQLCQVTGTLALAWKQNATPIIDQAWAYRQHFSIPPMYYAEPEGIDAHTLVDFEPAWARIYMGDYRIIEPYESLIRTYLKPSEQAAELLAPLLKRYQTSDRTSVHIRRGDYVGNPTYVELGREYYEPMPENALIFTDDPAYASTMYPGVEVVEPNDDWVDLFLMASCSSHVIANSSYSWWAAFMSGNPCIYPKQFFAIEWPDISHNYLPHWKAL
jgi:hypothetical protein